MATKLPTEEIASQLNKQDTRDDRHMFWCKNSVEEYLARLGYPDYAEQQLSEASASYQPPTNPTKD